MERCLARKAPASFKRYAVCKSWRVNWAMNAREPQQIAETPAHARKFKMLRSPFRNREVARLLHARAHRFQADLINSKGLRGS